ncbi:MAG: hypothetical protein AAB380_06485 [Verrucomicrobiota bacterium]
MVTNDCGRARHSVRAGAQPGTGGAHGVTRPTHSNEFVSIRVHSWL